MVCFVRFMDRVGSQEMVIFYRKIFLFSALRNSLNARCEKTAVRSGYFGIYRSSCGTIVNTCNCVTNSNHPPAKNQTVSVYTSLGIVMWS